MLYTVTSFLLIESRVLAHHAVLFRDSYFLNGNEVLKISELYMYIDKLKAKPRYRFVFTTLFSTS